MKKTILLCIVILFLLTTAVSLHAKSENIYPDLSNLSNWQIYKFVPEDKGAQESMKYFFHLTDLKENIVCEDPQNAYNGKPSILMKNVEGFGLSKIYKKFDLKEGSYKVSFYAKASLSQKADCAVLLAHDRYNCRINDIWKKYDFYFNIPCDTKNAAISITGNPYDKLWINCVKLSKLPVNISDFKCFRNGLKNTVVVEYSAQTKQKLLLNLNIEDLSGKTKKIAKYICAHCGANKTIFDFYADERGEYNIEFSIVDMASFRTIYSSRSIKYVIPKLMTLKLKEPCYRNNIYSSNPIKFIETECDFVFNNNGQSEYILNAYLKDNNNKIIDGYAAKIYPDNNIKAAFKFSTDKLQEGQYEINADLLTNDGKLICSEKAEINKLKPAKDEVIIDSGSRILLNGSPEFPVGAYFHILSKKAVEEFGFNTVFSEDARDSCDMIKKGWLVVPDGYVYNKDYKTYINEISSMGARAIVELEPGHQANKELFIKAYDMLLNNYGNAKILAYSFYDKPELKKHLWDVLDSARKDALLKDPYHPLYSAPYDPDYYERFAPYMDIIGIYPYPFGPVGKPLYCVAERFKKIRAVMPPGRAIFYIPQAFAEFPFFPKQPEPAELRAETYLALNQGANGILFYALVEIMNMDSPPGYAWFLPKTSLSAEVKKLTKEIKGLSRVLLSQEKNKLNITSDNKCIDFKVYLYNNEHYIIAVNMFDEGQKITFKIKSGNKGYKLYDYFTGNEVASFLNNSWKDVFENYEVKIYKIKQ